MLPPPSLQSPWCDLPHELVRAHAGESAGINGCSLKTAANLDAVRALPLGRLLLETDAPWCEIKPSSAGYAHVKTQWKSQKKEKFKKGDTVKGRCEPCHIVCVRCLTPLADECERTVDVCLSVCLCVCCCCCVCVCVACSQVAEVVASVKGVSVEEVARAAYANAQRLFFASTLGDAARSRLAAPSTGVLSVTEAAASKPLAAIAPKASVMPTPTTIHGVTVVLAPQQPAPSRASTRAAKPAVK